MPGAISVKVILINRASGILNQMFSSSSDLWPLRDQKYVLEALIFWLSERKEENKHLAVSLELRKKHPSLKKFREAKKSVSILVSIIIWDVTTTSVYSIWSQICNSFLTSLDVGGTNIPPIFRIALKKLFHIDCDWLKSRDS